MASSLRMFRVIVLGGISLVGAQACGGQEASGATDALPDVPHANDAGDSGQETFPSELPSFIDTGVVDTASDSGLAFDVGDAAPDETETDGFPIETK